MPFTNVWDDTFPPDTQLANLLGLDLRNFRLDTQQRMAAISGLDASKPAFGSDAQPANWNGVLFFAIDTGKAYQWNNPAWTEVTNSLLAKSNALKQFPAVINNLGTGLTTVATFNLTAGQLGASGQIRLSTAVFQSGGNGLKMHVKFGGTDLTNADVKCAVNNGSYFYNIQGGNFNSTTAQQFTAWFGGGGPTGVLFSFSSEPASSAENTANALTVLLQVASLSGTVVSVTFDPVILEFL